MLTLKEIADLVKGTLTGEGNLHIKGVADLAEAKENDISFVAEKKFLKQSLDSRAAAFIIKTGLKIKDKPIIEVSNPYLAIAKVLEKFIKKEGAVKGIHPAAIISNSAKIGRDISIQPYAVIQDNAEIGDSTVVGPFTYIGKNSKIGEGGYLYPRVIIMENVTIGKNVIIHPGAVIGSDGFGYTILEDGTFYKIPQIGQVIIEDDVEIGANTCIDRAMLSRTIIRKGSKIDNLVQIAHNCEIGENSILAGQSGLSGSVKLEKNVVLGGQVGVADHLSIGENSIVLAQSGVSKDLPANQVYWGYPADEVKKAWKNLAEMKRLSKLNDKIKILEAKIKELEEKIKT